MGSINSTAVQDGLGIKQDPISKIMKAKRTGQVAQVVAWLRGLEFKPSTAKNTK
jgi:hypothetical protein